jgi:CMP-N,N'-diacetyllegionaminic acid synthase
MLMKRLCSICVRAGSRGVVNKNIRSMCGKPLLVHSIEQAAASGLFDQIAVSSDSQEILDIAREAGATILVQRPAELAQDTSPKVPAIRHCLQSAEAQTGHEFDTIVDLDATSPLRTVEDIRACVELVETDAEVTNVITAAPARRSPYFNLIEQSVDGTVSVSKKPPGAVVRRQDAPACFDMNASIYAWRRQALLAHDSIFLYGTRLHVMPEERSIDIDSELDFKIVEMLMGSESRRGV